MGGVREEVQEAQDSPYVQFLLIKNTGQTQLDRSYGSRVGSVATSL